MKSASSIDAPIVESIEAEIADTESWSNDDAESDVNNSSVHKVNNSSVHDTSSPGIPRVAICVVGELRGFTADPVWNSIYKTVDALKADTFLYLKLDVADDVRKLGSIMKILNSAAVQFLIRAQNVSWDSEKVVWNNTCPTFKLSSKDTKSMAYKFAVVSRDQAACFSLIKRREDDSGVKYDFVIKLRPDEEICRPIKSLERFPVDKVSAWYASRHIHDHIAVIPRTFANAYFSAGDEILKCSSRESYDRFCHVSSNDMPDDIPNECLLGRWLHSQGISIDNGKVLGHPDFLKWSTPNSAHKKRDCEIKIHQYKRGQIKPLPF